MTKKQVDVKPAKASVSVILPHGGQERLPHLTATLTTLRQCRDVGELIVVEMGPAPHARNVARRSADKYVFTYHSGAFVRARALNIGIGLAEYDLLLWQDNDLLPAPPFISQAIVELQMQQLDYLIPYTSVRYLSESDSQEVISGVRDPAACQPVNVLTSGRQACGGMALVKKTFVRQHGGMPEGFRGWGAEDNAWFHKARLLGRTGVTQRSDQHVYHLFHRRSGGYDGRALSGAHNPHYADNIALLSHMFSIREPRRFRRCFPPPVHHVCPWKPDKRIVILNDDSMTARPALGTCIAKSLIGLYGVKVEMVSRSGLDRAQVANALSLDALVLFGMVRSLGFLSNTTIQTLWPKTLLVLAEDTVPTVAMAKKLRLAGAILTPHRDTKRALRHIDVQPWPFPLPSDDRHQGDRMTLALVQPLSLILSTPTCR